MKHQRSYVLAVLLAACMLAFTACGAATDSLDMDRASGEKGYYSSYDNVMSSEVPSAPSYSLSGKAEQENSGLGASASDVQPADRKMIKTMRISAETKSFDEAAASIETLTAELGGYVEASSRSGGTMRNSSSVVARSASYTLRIPAERLDEFRAGIGGEINIVSESSEVDDITDSYFDVETRLETLKVQEERLLAMLETATELEYMLTLEARLSEVRYEIESYTGTLRRYDSQVAYSTVRLSLDEVIEYTAVTPAPQTFGQRLRVAFTDSWSGFADGCKNFAIGFVYALPTLLVLAVVFGAIAGIVAAVVKKTSKRKKGE